MSRNIGCVKKIAIDTNNVELCEERLGPEDRAECIYKIATETLDAELCNKFDNQVNVDSCRYKIAKLSGDEELCQGIKIDEIKRTCEDHFAQK